MSMGQTKNRAPQYSGDKDLFFVLVPCLLLCIVIALVVMFTEYQPPEDQPCGSNPPEYDWSLQYPTDVVLYDIVALDADHVWAVGELGTILFYDGHEWTKQESGTDKDLISVSGVQPSVVWAIGNAVDRSKPGSGPGEGIILSFEDGTWVEKERPEYHIYKMAVGDEEQVWFAGGCAIYLWDGSTYTDKSGDIIYVPRLLALDSTRVWAFGKVESSFYDGDGWKYYDVMDISPEGRWEMFPVRTATAIDANHVWGVGWNGTIYFFDGNEWSFQESGTDWDLVDVEAIDEVHVWAVGHGVGAKGAMLFFNRKKWSIVENQTDSFFTDITASDNDHIWAIGEGGIYFGTPGGE